MKNSEFGTVSLIPSNALSFKVLDMVSKGKWLLEFFFLCPEQKLHMVSLINGSIRFAAV
jgi:hypothetical protein